MHYSFIKVTIFLTCFLAFSSLYYMHIFYQEDIKPLKITKHTSLFFNNETKKNFLVYTAGCRIPKYDPYDFTVRRYFVKTPFSYNCGPKESIFFSKEGGVVSVNEVELLKQYHVKKDQLECYFYPILRKNRGRKPDDVFYLGKEHAMIFDLPIDDDFILLKCKTDNATLPRVPLLLTPTKPKVEKKCDSAFKAFKEKLSVLMVGIDSISKLNFLRYFKKTLGILRNDLSAFELNGFIKVADNTYPNLIPLLTGRHRNHYKVKEKRYGYYDDVDFIWKRYSAAGYRTLFSEDAPNMGAFVLNRRGFKNPPTDYYSRPFSVAVETLNLRRNTHCIGSRLEMEVYFDYLKNFLSTMSEKLVFTFTFVARLTHDIFKNAGYADKPSFELLTYLKDQGILNRSLLIFFSDHGIRFGDIRRTYIGKIEERMPFMFLSFPDWFLKKYPTVASSLRSNRNRLTTPYDIHATLLHLLDFDRETYFTLHGQSLFNEISGERTCADAMVSKHWCTCQTHKVVPTDDAVAKRSALTVVNRLNKVLKPFRKLCASLKLDKVLDARVVRPNAIIDKMTTTEKDYLVTLQVLPSEAIFEATVQVKQNRFKIMDEVSRINKYNNESSCVHDPSVVKYCFCKSQSEKK